MHRPRQVQVAAAASRRTLRVAAPSHGALRLRHALPHAPPQRSRTTSPVQELDLDDVPSSSGLQQSGRNVVDGWVQPTDAELLLERQGSGALASTSSTGVGETAASRGGKRSRHEEFTFSSSHSQAFPWLFSNHAAAISPLGTRTRYADVLSAAMHVLQHYDIRSREGRTPHLRKNTRVIEPCLTARAAAIEAARRRPRLEAPEDEGLEQRLTVILERDEGEEPQPVEDDAWRQKQRAQQSYLTYLQQLKQQLEVQQRTQADVLRKLQPGADVVQQLQAELDQQLMYQIGIADDWVQCRHLLDVFRDSLSPGPAAALFKRLSDLLAAPKARTRMSPSEGCEFQDFCRDLSERTLPLVPRLAPNQVGHVAYALACLELTSCTSLLEALVQHAGTLLSAQLSSSSRSGSGSARGRGKASPGGSAAQQQQQQQQRGAAATAAATPAEAQATVFVAADYANLVWSLGTLGYRPQAAWLDALCMCSLPRLDVFQPSQLWGVLWGLARLGHVPQHVWMQRFLMCAERVMAEFTAESLCHLVWALGAMGYVPEKTWLRSCIGQIRFKYRSLLAPQLTMLMEGLAALGYKPREQICWSLQAQARRYLHAYSAGQQATLMRAMAMLTKFQPQRQFLYDFVTHSQPKLASMTVFQLSGILWAFARFKYLPDKAYISALLTHMHARMAPALPSPTGGGAAAAAAAAAAGAQPSGPALSQAAWALATLSLGSPGPQWLATWSLRARQGLDTFTPQCLAHTLWALPRLSSDPPEAELLEGLLRRAAQELPAMSCMELTTTAAALAELRYRPSDAWLAAFAEHARGRLDGFSNQDFGLLTWAMATLAAPLDAAWLQAMERAAGRKWWSMDLEGMALLLWGLAQYGRRPDSRDWWAGFWSESELRWEGASARTLAMLTLALGELVTTAPSRTWQRSLMRAIRLTFPKPASSSGVAAMLREAAGLGPDEPLPKTPWLRLFLSELKAQWGFARTLA